MREYRFSDVLGLVPRLSRSQAINLTAKKVIEPDALASRGTGHHRRFSFLNLTEFAVAAELVQINVEHYAIAQVLRRLRWLIGDPKGLEGWNETFFATPLRQRTRLDTRLLWIALDPIFQFSVEWLHDPVPDLSELDPDDKVFVESVRERIKKLPNPSQITSPESLRSVRAMLRESPYAQKGIRAWERFKVRSTRPDQFYLLIWAADVQEFNQLTSSGAVQMTQARWVFDLASSPEELAEVTMQPGARIVINLHQIVSDLELVTGERLEDVGRLSDLFQAPLVR